MIDRSGGARTDLFALGPAGLGSQLESVSVPEIVRQAQAAARTLASHLDVKSAAAA